MSQHREIIEGAFPKSLRNPPKEVAHYTRMETLTHILRQGGVCSLRATGLRYLNDRRELRHGLEILKEAAPISRIQSVLDQLEDAPDIYQVSFSGAPDELGQWRGYGHNGLGCSVIVDGKGVYEAATFAGWVIYDRKSQKEFVDRVLNNLKSSHSALDADELGIYLLAAAAFMKHEGFRAEREYRLLVVPGTEEVIDVRPSGDRLAPYIDVLRPSHPSGSHGRVVPSLIGVNRILIGPGWQLGELESESPAAFLRHHVPLGIVRLLERYGIRAKVAASAIPYDPR